MKRVSCLFALLSLICVSSAWAASCSVAPAHTISKAQQAFLHTDYASAYTLYSQSLQATPNDPELTAGLVDVLLKQQKVEEADGLIQKSIAAHPKSVVLQTSLGLVQYRQGTPNLAAATANAAMALDPCYPRLHLLNMQLLRLNSMFKSASRELKTGHLLDPADPQIKRYWLRTLPLRERISEAEAYLTSANGDDPDDVRHMRMYLEGLKKFAAQPHKSCHLTSSNASTQIPFAPIMRDANYIRAFGLDVKFNDHSARLEIDTGASGLVISRSVANAAGLEAFNQTEISGVGSGAEKSGYTAFVDSIKIGTLESHDCRVEVLDSRNVVGVDGLIGMDVFSNLLVTLDYPMRRLNLDPLPQRPQEASADALSLATNANDDMAQADSTAKKVAIGPQDRYVAHEMKDWAMVYRIGHNLIVPAAINESKVKLFILDTGAFATSISPEAAREVTKLHSNDRMVIHGLSGKVEKVFEADNVSFAFANIRQKVPGAVAFDTSKISKNAGTEISGFIGITTLGQLTVKIDYRDGLVKFDYDANRGYHLPNR